MLKTDLFAQLGILSVKNFVSREFCTQILTESQSANSQPASVYKANTMTRIVDKTFCKSHALEIKPETSSRLQTLLINLRSQLEQHFKQQLLSFEGPSFLCYQQGDFFKWHVDNQNPSSQDRVVTVVFFLNSSVATQEPEHYMGGTLEFYAPHLQQEKAYKGCCLAIIPEAGSFVAFRSDTYHQVQPVTWGKRYTITSWFRQI